MPKKKTRRNRDFSRSADSGGAFDLRPIAEKIADRVVAKRNLATGKKSPLILVLGENHSMPAHIMTSMMVIRRLQEKGFCLAVGMEQSANLIEESFSRYSRLVYARDRMPISYPQLALKKYIIDERRAAPISSSILGIDLLTRKIPVFFTDVSQYSQAIHLTEPEVAAVCEEMGLRKDEPVECESPQGIALRNTLMVQRASNHISRLQNLDIFVIVCGSNHMAGSRTQHQIIPYDRSIAQLLIARNYEVLAVPFQASDWCKDNLPPEHGLNSDNSLLDIQPPENSFYRSDQAAELEFLRIIFTASGLQRALLHHETNKDTCQHDVIRQFNQWIMNVGKHSPLPLRG